ncbi:hypothetical protein X943_002451 [Babesia divergens]|uniref:Uncharacterized protein n=1 Tax=Babesia divergens TaxID=32595 RepID=A0AAD9GFF8_BABDI|nr:hypothetical protein X943_002451 [Babesia divergens]
MDHPCSCGHFRPEESEQTNDRVIYVKPPGIDHGYECMDVSAHEMETLTLMRNILYCFHFLDTQDREYINSSAAEEYIRQLKHDNPELFDIMYNVLLVVKQSHGNENIAKDLFIKRCEESLRKLGPYDASPMSALWSPKNPLAKYFNDLKRLMDETRIDYHGCRYLIMEGRRNKEGSSPMTQNMHHATDTDINPAPCNQTESYDIIEDECTFRPKINKTPCPVRSANISLMLKKEIEEMHRFRCSKFASVDVLYQCYSGPSVSSGIDEYIVFHLNKPSEWSHTLRSLKDHNA